MRSGPTHFCSLVKAAKLLLSQSRAADMMHSKQSSVCGQQRISGSSEGTLAMLLRHAITDKSTHCIGEVPWLHFGQSSLPGWILVTTCPTLDASKQLLGCIWDVFNGAEDIL